MASQLAQPVHQAVNVRVDTKLCTWAGHTDIKVLVPTEQASVGLHCFHLNIHRVFVDGEPAQFTLREYAHEVLPEPTVEQLRKGQAPISMLSEYAYSQYINQVQREQEPELLITLPPKADAAAAATPAAEAITATGAGAPSTAGAATPSVKTQQPATLPAPAASAEGDRGLPALAAAASTSSQPVSTPPKQNGTANGLQASQQPHTPSSAPQPSTSQAAGAATHSRAAASQHTPGSRAASAAPPATPAAAAAGPRGTSVTLTIYFSKAGSDSSLCFAGGWMVADPGLRRSRGWFPCIDSPVYTYTPSAPHYVPYTFDLKLTVGPEEVAVCSGTLVQQTLGVQQGTTADGRRQTVCRTWHYSIGVPCVPAHIVMAVGPFDIHPGAALFASANGANAAAAAANGPVITAFVPKDVSQHVLQATLRPLQLIMRVCEKALACRFPFPYLQVAVVPAEAMDQPLLAGLGCLLVSSDMLVDETLIEPVVECVLTLARGIAEQYFGALLLAKGPEDAWLLQGLVGWLQGQVIKQVLGANELAYRRWREREAVLAVDDGQTLPPLAQPQTGAGGIAAATRGWGLLFGTQALDPSPAWRWKATAVVGMIERRVGEEEFRKLLERFVNGARTAAAKASTEPTQPINTPATAATAQPAPSDSGQPAAGHGQLAVVPPSAPAAAASPGAAGPAAVAVPAAGGAARDRFLSAAHFLRTVGKKEGFKQAGNKKEILQFTERWISGAGVPTIMGGIAYDKRKGVLAVALRQKGSAACLKAALRAHNPAAKDNTAGVLKVLVRETDASEEHAIAIGADEALTLAELKVSSRLEKRRPKRGRGGGGAGGGPGRHEGLMDGVSEGQLRGVPVLWVRVDPGLEWLADVRLALPLGMWSLMLDKCKDVVAQAQAVAAISAMDAHDGVVDELIAALRRPGLFCRLRCDAALALGATATEVTQLRGASELIAYFREQCFDPTTLMLKPNCFSDLAEHAVLQTIPLALSVVRDAERATPENVLQLLISVLRNNDNSGNPFDDGHWLAAFVEALGNVRVSNNALLAKVLHEIDRQLAHEAVVGTHNNVLGVACLHALTSLATNLQSRFLTVLDDVAKLLRRYVRPGTPRHMRAAAGACLIQVAASRPQDQASADGQPYRPLDATLQEALGLFRAEPVPALKRGILREALLLVGQLRLAAGGGAAQQGQQGQQDAKAPAPVGIDTLLELHGLLSCHDDPVVRHVAFMLQQRITGQPATLYREREEEEEEVAAAAAGQAPSHSNRTGGVTAGVRPAASQGRTLSGLGAKSFRIKLQTKLNPAAKASAGGMPSPTRSTQSAQPAGSQGTALPEPGATSSLGAKPAVAPPAQPLPSSSQQAQQQQQQQQNMVSQQAAVLAEVTSVPAVLDGRPPPSPSDVAPKQEPAADVGPSPPPPAAAAAAAPPPLPPPPPAVADTTAQMPSTAAAKEQARPADTSLPGPKPPSILLPIKAEATVSTAPSPAAAPPDAPIAAAAGSQKQAGLKLKRERAPVTAPPQQQEQQQQQAKRQKLSQPLPTPAAPIAVGAQEAAAGVLSAQQQAQRQRQQLQREKTPPPQQPQQQPQPVLAMPKQEVPPLQRPQQALPQQRQPTPPAASQQQRPPTPPILQLPPVPAAPAAKPAVTIKLKKTGSGASPSAAPAQPPAAEPGPVAPAGAPVAHPGSSRGAAHPGSSRGARSRTPRAAATPSPVWSSEPQPPAPQEPQAAARPPAGGLSIKRTPPAPAAASAPAPALPVAAGAIAAAPVPTKGRLTLGKRPPAGSAVAASGAHAGMRAPAMPAASGTSAGSLLARGAGASPSSSAQLPSGPLPVPAAPSTSTGTAGAPKIRMKMFGKGGGAAAAPAAQPPPAQPPPEPPSQAKKDKKRKR